MKKRGYFFTLDAFIAMGVIVVGLLLVFSFRSESMEQTQTEFFSQDLILLLSSTRIFEINNPYIDHLRKNGTINNSRYTVLEQIGELYYINNLLDASKIIQNVSAKIVPDNYGFEIIIQNESIYLKNVKGEDYYANPNRHKVLVSSKRIISGEINNTVMWGPLNAEVRVWR